MSASLSCAPLVPRPRLGFAGVGWIGHHRLCSLRELNTVHVAAVADPVRTLRARASCGDPNTRECEHFDELLDLDLDGVVIATPSAMHAEQAMAALARGMAVFCQKPMGRSAAETRAVVAAARQADRPLWVDLCYRHSHAFRQLRTMVQSGVLGEVFGGRLVFHNAYGPDKAWFYDPSLSGGGCVMDLGTHLLDLASWLTGEPIVTIRGAAFGKAQRLSRAGESAEDYGSATVTLRSGADLQLGCSWKVHAGQDAVIEAELFGSNGGGAVRNVNGSFYDFEAHHHQGTARRRVSSPPDQWGGRALARWAQELSLGRGFDPQAMQLVGLSEAVDRWYGQEGNHLS